MFDLPTIPVSQSWVEIILAIWQQFVSIHLFCSYFQIFSIFRTFCSNEGYFVNTVDIIPLKRQTSIGLACVNAFYTLRATQYMLYRLWNFNIFFFPPYMRDERYIWVNIIRHLLQILTNMIQIYSKYVNKRI